MTQDGELDDATEQFNWQVVHMVEKGSCAANTCAA